MYQHIRKGVANLNLKKILTKNKPTSSIPNSKHLPSRSKPDLMQKSLYIVSKTITPEKMIEKRGEVTKAEIRTTSYLRKLENALELDTLEYSALRYKG